MNYYKHHIGDYAKKTVALSLVDHGAYLLMLHAYYGTEEPLPLGEDLYRIAHAHTPVERAAVDKIAQKYWTRTPTGLVNGRAFEEIAAATVLIDTARVNGANGGRPKKTQRVRKKKPSGLSDGNPAGLVTKTQRVKKRKAIQVPGSTIQTPRAKSHSPPPSASGSRGSEGGGDFEKHQTRYRTVNGVQVPDRPAKTTAELEAEEADRAQH